MLTSIATVSLSGTLEEKIDAIAAAEFDGLEIFENDLLACPLSPAEIRRRCEERSLTVDLLQPLRDLEGGTGPAWEASLRRAAAKFALARELGAPTVLACASVQPDAVDDDALVVEQLRQLGDLAAEHGVRIAYEALAWSTHVSTYDHAWRLVEAAAHPAVGLCLDSFHMFSVGSTLEAMAEIPGDRIFFCQLADAPALSLDTLSWSRHYRVFPGQGSFDIPGFVSALVATGYQGPLSIEVFNDLFRQTDPGRTAVDAMRSLRYLQDLVRPAAAAAAQSRLVRLTSAQPVHAIDFVELRAGDDPELRRALTGLGLTGLGTHRSKPVTAWTRGEVRVVVNHSEPVPSAPRLAAVGFQVRDPDAWVRRADQLLVPEEARTTGPGEEMLRVVSSPEGTRILVAGGEGGDPAWLDEFPAARPELAGSPVGNAGIVGIDHISLSQSAETVDATVLFARAVLGLAPSSSVDVPDPSGLVRSQVLASPDDGVRLILNVLPQALASGTPAGGAHSEHVAFRSDDIFDTARSLQEHGVPLLPIPGNYYDDLVSRFGLSPAWVGRLREHQLLYDEDADGSFLQLYTSDLGEVFLEVVERVGGYAGFGAHNAPIRRAAQRRAAQCS